MHKKRSRETSRTLHPPNEVYLLPGFWVHCFGLLFAGSLFSFAAFVCLILAAQNGVCRLHKVKKQNKKKRKKNDWKFGLKGWQTTAADIDVTFFVVIVNKLEKLFYVQKTNVEKSKNGKMLVCGRCCCISATTANWSISINGQNAFTNRKVQLQL